MRKVIFVAALASTTASYGADIDASLAISASGAPKVEVEAKLNNHSDRDYCFFQSLSVPTLGADNGQRVPARFAFEPDGPIFSNEDGYVAIWTRPNNEQVVWRGTDNVFRYTLELVSEADLNHLRYATLDIDVFDCVDLHRKPWHYPINPGVEHITLHLKGNVISPSPPTPAPSRP